MTERSLKLKRMEDDETKRVAVVPELKMWKERSRSVLANKFEQRQGATKSQKLD